MVDSIFTLQWHINSNCNLKCLHCYQENKEDIALEYTYLINILEQYKEFLRHENKKGHINLTGGEPLCNKNFYKILDYMSKDQDLYSYAILTNGTLITDEVAKKISEYKPQYVQVSLDGGKKIHEEIRGKGTFNKTLHAIKNLKKYGIYTSISFTAHKKNFREFKKVVDAGRKVKVNRVWTDRFIPIGGARKLKELSLNQEETREFFESIRKEKDKQDKKIQRYIEKNNVTYMEALKNNTEVSMVRALQFLESDTNIYSCSAGTSLITIMENGDLVPCRRMPIVIGNVLKDGSICKLYESSKIIKELQKKKIPEKCNGCENSDLCRGGLKCLAYAFEEDIYEKDPRMLL